jgi:CRISPR-associated endonuclease/helicase Cas3
MDKVGHAERFNDHGAIPTNKTTRDVLRDHEENDWQYGDLLRLLTDMAGLLHDLGKATQAFQDRLNNKLKGRNLVRHEWVSLRLLEAFVGENNDADWLTKLASPKGCDPFSWTNALHRDMPNQANPSPFKGLSHSPLATALGWLVVSHHRLPVLPYGFAFQTRLLEDGLKIVDSTWNEEEFKNATEETLHPYWHFPLGLPVNTTEWHRRAARIAIRLSRYANTDATHRLLNNPFVLHLARLSLMLADHHYSSLEIGPNGKPASGRVHIAKPNRLAANTRMGGQINQPLDEHLVGVAQHGSEVAQFLPQFERHLPRLAKHRKLKQRSDLERFRWQDNAFDLASRLREVSQESGAFIVNMASTGCGKTLANARIMYALADPTLGMRCSFAMGLRTLTLQTGQAFRQLLGLDDDELAIRVGGTANRMLFEHFEKEAEATGSASRQALIEEDGHVIYDGQIDKHPLLKRAISDPEIRKLLIAPLLVCTVDHLTPATESPRGGRQIAPMLRLMSGDLVLDEPDDFDISDLPALTRLVHWAGLLGSRILLSSATLPPALVQGLFEAYLAGRQQFGANRRTPSHNNDTNSPVCCIWTDEFTQHHASCNEQAHFSQQHQDFIHTRAKALAEQAKAPRRKVALRALVGLSTNRDEACKAFAIAAMQSALELHVANHSIDTRTGKRVSFGLVRMANVEPLVQVALAMFSQGVAAGQKVHLCVYHSRHPLLIRSSIEQQLDTTLKRHNPDAVFDLIKIRSCLDNSSEQDHLFIVLGSPVTEVGRDHDYDWAVVEPSSMRSIIQLLGRVRRHRPGQCQNTNVHVFSRNLRSFTHPADAAFCKPGFEKNAGAFRLKSHDLHDLLDSQVLSTLDARPRIVCDTSQVLNPQIRLADLEHARMFDQMLVKMVVKSGRKGTASSMEANASTWWRIQPKDAMLTGLLQQEQPFRDDSNQREVSLVLLPDEEGENVILHQVEDLKGGKRGEKLYVAVESLHRRYPDSALKSPSVCVWGVQDFMTELRGLSESMDRPLNWCAQRFGTVNVPANDSGWVSHPALGFWRAK